MIKNIMIAFVSLVNERTLKEPIKYPDVCGSPYVAIQTNEAAVMWLERKYKDNPLDKLFLIASKKVRENFLPWENEFGKVTHKEFLEKRLLKERPDLQERFCYFNYSEGGGASAQGDESAYASSQGELGQNLLEVAEIARGIQAYINEHQGDKVVVHADMTGGMRHASMMMLSIMQLLKYHGVEIGRVLYSDPMNRRVYEATPIQRMFTLINGADEFVKFGSVNAIREYFEPYESDISEPLKELLLAMRRFSEAIKLCRTAVILDEVKNLGAKIEAFQAKGGINLQEKLFSQIINTIQREYGKLLEHDVKQTDIIEWCMEKEFWQQTLTLCTEWIPEILVDKKIAYTEDENVKGLCEIEGEKMSRNWKQDFIMRYNGGAPKPIDSNTRDIKSIRDWLYKYAADSHMDDKAIEELDKMPKFKKLIFEYIEGKNIYHSIQEEIHTINDLRNRYKLFAELLNAIYDQRYKGKENKKPYYTFIKNLPYESILINAQTMTADRLELFIEKKAQEENKEELQQIAGSKPQIKGTEKWENRSNQYWQMYKEGILKTGLTTPKEMLEYLHGYMELKDMRNQINHASKAEDIPIADIKRKIGDYIKRLAG